MPKRFGLALEAWPQADRAAWERATASDDFFADEASAAHWRAASRRQAFYAYSRWLAFVGERWPDAVEQAPHARATGQRVKLYVETLTNRRLTPMGIAAELQHLLLALRALSPRDDWRWLGQLQYSWQRRAQPRDLRHKMIDPRRLFDLGLELMARADEHAIPVERARQFRDGLLIALLIAVPIRRRSLAALELERNLRRLGQHYMIVLDREDTKAGHAVEFDVPMRLTPHISRYLEHYRPVFPHAEGQAALWLSSKGGRLGADAIYDLMARRTTTAFGFSIHPHFVRTIAASTIAREAPEKIALARDLLAHASLATTLQHYARAQTVQAARAYGALVGKLRDGDPAADRRPRPGHSQPAACDLATATKDSIR